MKGYLNRILGRGHQPTYGTKETVGPPPHGGSSIKRHPTAKSAFDESTQRIADELTEQFGWVEVSTINGIIDPPFDETLYNKRMDLLKYLVENNAEDALGDEINALLTSLLEQLQVKVFEPPDLLTDESNEEGEQHGSI